MKEILKNKVMMGFLIFMIGISFANSVQTKKMEQNSTEDNIKYISLNIK